MTWVINTYEYILLINLNSCLHFFAWIGLYTEINAQAIQGTLNHLAHTKLSQETMN